VNGKSGAILGSGAHPACMSCKLDGLKKKGGPRKQGGGDGDALGGCQESPSLVVGILRFVLKHVAAG